MSFKVDANIAPVVEGAVLSLSAFAGSQQVSLTFIPPESEIIRYYHPREILKQLVPLLSQIITFTPQEHSVTVALEIETDIEDKLHIRIQNTGANLSRSGDIIKEAVSQSLRVEVLDSGTEFYLSLNLPSENAKNQSEYKGAKLPKQYPHLYKNVLNNLRKHFANRSSLERLVEGKGPRAAVFLKKLNTIIDSNMGCEDFGVAELASAMALSRSQLYRKLKNLSDRSPQEYLTLARLLKAKEYLLTRDNEWNVSEVGYRVGFSGKSHFSRAFHKQFGFNPSECLKNPDTTQAQLIATSGQ